MGAQRQGRGHGCDSHPRRAAAARPPPVCRHSGSDRDGHADDRRRRDARRRDRSRGCIPTHMEALTAKLLEMGVRVEEQDDAIRVRSHRRPPRGDVQNAGLPRLPDRFAAAHERAALPPRRAHRPWRRTFSNPASATCRRDATAWARGCAIYEQIAVIEGVPQLHGAAVDATDLRAGAALVIAGLMARGHDRNL